MAFKMMSIVAATILFAVFYRLTLIHPSAYLAIPVGVMGLILFLCRRKLPSLRCVNQYLVCFFLLLGLFFFVKDVLDYQYEGNFHRSFIVRWLAVVVISILPAYFLNEAFIKGREDFFVKLLVWILWFQLGFWLLTFVSLDAKVLINSVMGRGDSVNLRSHNLGTRGFGASADINFTSPFVMVMLSFFYLVASKKVLVFLTIITQLINSNMVIVSLVLSFVFSTFNVLKKLLLLFFSSAIVLLMGERVFSRFYAELSSGGLRTIKILINDHMFVLNKGVFEHLFGTGIHVFQGGYSRNSDIGWLIMYNYGGLFFCVLFAFCLLLATVAAFGIGRKAMCWFLAGLLLNTKGLLFGPNTYVFATALIAFIRWDNSKSRQEVSIHV